MENDPLTRYKSTVVLPKFEEVKKGEIKIKKDYYSFTWR